MTCVKKNCKHYKWNPKIHSRIYWSRPGFGIFTHIDRAQPVILYFVMIHFSIILFPAIWPKNTLLLGLRIKFGMNSLLSDAYRLLGQLTLLSATLFRVECR
jgi:hypothetical protein